MPIPAALLARLQKRGITVKQEEKRPEKKTKLNEDVEEVFAEDYDNDDPMLPVLAAAAIGAKATPELSQEEPVEKEREGPLIYEVTGCPNISNPFHECNDWCQKRWGNKMFDPESDMLRKKERMLRKYPLPDEWEEVADPTTQRFYYWNPMTDEISWLSPSHPKAKISVAEDKLRDLVRATEVRIIVEDKPEKKEVTKVQQDDDFEFEALENEIQKEKKQKQKQREKPRSKRKRDDELDPMDPASYSDIPRGNWSSGLEQRGAAKTGVDTTASGPLFQQRPYPSPGDILRANRKADD